MIVAHAQQPPFRKLLGRSPPSASSTGRATVLIRPNPAKPAVTAEWCTWVPRELRFMVTTTDFRHARYPLSALSDAVRRLAILAIPADTLAICTVAAMAACWPV